MLRHASLSAAILLLASTPLSAESPAQARLFGLSLEYANRLCMYAGGALKLTQYEISRQHQRFQGTQCIGHLDTEQENTVLFDLRASFDTPGAFPWQFSVERRNPKAKRIEEAYLDLSGVVNDMSQHHICRGLGGVSISGEIRPAGLAIGSAQKLYACRINPDENILLNQIGAERYAVRALNDQELNQQQAHNMRIVE